MALDNALVYRVFGAAIVQVGTGANSALETLGYTREGVTVKEHYALEPIMTDVMGPILPGEMQKFGIEAFVECPLISWNPTIWEKVQKKMANSTTAGQFAASGTLMFTGGFTTRCALVSADSLEDPFYFPTCVVREPTSRKQASKHNELVVQFYATAFHLASTTSITNSVAWSRTLPP